MVNSVCTDWLAWRRLAKYYSPPSHEQKQNGFPFQMKLLLNKKSYSLVH